MFEIISSVVAATVLAIIRSVMDRWSAKKRDSELDAAEKKAFSFAESEIIRELEALKKEHKETRSELFSSIDGQKRAIELGYLSNFYAKQIESYQDQTKSRASWSFYIALIAMFLGFTFLFWGGRHILTKTDWDHIAAGSAIAAIGGSISAFITKTFLDVHRLSLEQLNNYFKQPVINDHILMAQRLAENLDDPSAKQRAYEKIIESVTGMIEPNQDNDLQKLTGAKGT